MSLLKMDKNNKTLETTSVILRIHDNQRELMFSKGYYGDISNQYLPQDRLQKLSFKPEDAKKVANVNESAKTLMPNGIS